MITTIGRYYVNELLRYPNYLYKLIYDLPLTHSAWKKSEYDSYRMRVGSLYEYLTTVLSVERKELEAIGGRREYRDTMIVFAKKGLLARHIVDMALRINEGALRSRTSSGAAAGFAEDWAVRFRLAEEEVRSLEGRVRDYFSQLDLVFPSEAHAPEMVQVADEKSEVVVQAPRVVEPGRLNTCYLTAHLGAYAREIDPDEQIVALWSCEAEGMHFRKLVPLSRSSPNYEYIAEISFEEASNRSAFPASHVTLFSGPELIKSSALSASDV